MSFVKTLLYMMILLIIIVITLFFGLRNKQAITVDFLFIQFSSLGAGFWIIASLVIGVLLGWLLSLPKGITLKISNQSHRRKLKNQSDELSRLKGSSLKGS